jgi:NDP-4-keto-2,6-dideoxyhexose 3-C-methyltransferase
VFQEIKQCRICGNNELVPLLNIGTQFLTGVFPRNKNQQISSGPLELVRCVGDKDKTCGLVQLKHSFDLGEMYGENYGYRSGLNNSMVKHLYEIVHNILNAVNLRKGDLIIDIGSNDSTLLQAYGNKDYLLVGIDPTGNKFKQYYPQHINLITDFFSKKVLNKCFGDKKAKIVTSIAMFYDLESPIDFAQQIYDILADDGIWILEQSYLSIMIAKNAYDTICHEHLEYYSLRQIKWITDRVGFKIIDVEQNDINGGSFLITVAKSTSAYDENNTKISKLLNSEKELDKNEKYAVFNHKEKLIDFIHKTNAEKKLILGYGASTKGNVILQFCNLTTENIPYVAEINEDKFGSFTPGTFIPIISEKEAKAMKPDFFMVLPWHFRENIVHKEKDYLRSGGKLLFPLPLIEVI